MRERGLNVVAMKKDLVFGELKPMFMTYHSAKGLTVDSVFLPGLSETSFKNIESSSARCTLLFVGITRATHWVWLGQRTEDPLDEIDVLAKLERTSSVKRQDLKSDKPVDDNNSNNSVIIPVNITSVDEPTRSGLPANNFPRIVKIAPTKDKKAEGDPTSAPIPVKMQASPVAKRAALATPRKAVPIKKAPLKKSATPIVPGKSVPVKKANSSKNAEVNKPNANPSQTKKPNLDDLLDLL
jgi:hypothetical protein